MNNSFMSKDFPLHNSCGQWNLLNIIRNRSGGRTKSSVELFATLLSSGDEPCLSPELRALVAAKLDVLRGVDGSLLLSKSSPVPAAAVSLSVPVPVSPNDRS